MCGCGENHNMHRTLVFTVYIQCYTYTFGANIFANSHHKVPTWWRINWHINWHMFFCNFSVVWGSKGCQILLETSWFCNVCMRVCAIHHIEYTKDARSMPRSMPRSIFWGVILDILKKNVWLRWKSQHAQNPGIYRVHSMLYIHIWCKHIRKFTS